jgi:predicted NBD/HSP70 family sugar kinase
LRKSYPWPTPPLIIEFVDDGIEQIAPDGMPGSAWRDRVAGLGIATPFELWNWTEQAGAPRDEMDLVARLRSPGRTGRVCDMPVYLQNDATAACAPRNWFSASIQGLTTISISISAPLSAAAWCSMAASIPAAPAMPARSALCRSPARTASRCN